MCDRGGNIDPKVVTPDRIRVWEDAFHVLYVSVDGEEHEDVRAVSAFPISGKADYVAFLNQKSNEVALVSDPQQLDQESRATLEAYLAKVYYVPKVQRVDMIRETWGVAHWQVLTDRGYAEFEVTNRDNIRRLPHGRYIITDADGNRFEIEDVTQLDSRSQALVSSET